MEPKEPEPQSTRELVLSQARLSKSTQISRSNAARTGCVIFGEAVLPRTEKYQGNTRTPICNAQTVKSGTLHQATLNSGIT